MYRHRLATTPSRSVESQGRWIPNNSQTRQARPPCISTNIKVSSQQSMEIACCNKILLFDRVQLPLVLRVHRAAMRCHVHFAMAQQLPQSAYYSMRIQRFSIEISPWQEIVLRSAIIFLSRPRIVTDVPPCSLPQTTCTLCEREVRPVRKTARPPQRWA